MIPLNKVLEILTEIPDRYRALILLGTFASLRWGELAGLRRQHLDLDAGVVRVVSIPRRSFRTCKRTWTSSPKTSRSAESSSGLGAGLFDAPASGAFGTRFARTLASLTSTLTIFATSATRLRPRPVRA